MRCALYGIRAKLYNITIIFYIMSYFRLTSNLFSYSENPSCWLDFNNVICLLRLCCVFGYVVFLIANPKAGRLSKPHGPTVQPTEYLQVQIQIVQPFNDPLTPTQLTKCLKPWCCDCCQRQKPKRTKHYVNIL